MEQLSIEGHNEKMNVGDILRARGKYCVSDFEIVEVKRRRKQEDPANYITLFSLRLLGLKRN